MYSTPIELHPESWKSNDKWVRHWPEETFGHSVVVTGSLPAHASAPSANFSPKRKRIVELVGKYRPAIYYQKKFVDTGGLTFYVDLYRQVAAHVDKIFKGAKTGWLPMQQATKFELLNKP